MKNMLLRYIKLYIHFTKINISSFMEYDADFLFGIVALILKNLINLLIIFFIFHFIDNIKGWDFNQILFLYGFSSTSFAIWHCFFINTISLPFYTRTGLLDSFLLKPVDVIFQIMADSFDEDGIGDLIFGIIVLIIAIVRLKIVSIKLIFLPVLLLSGSLIYASLGLISSSISFFTIGETGLSNLVMDFFEFSKYPITIYNDILKIVFTVLIPIGFTAFYPSLFYIANYKYGLMLVLITPVVSILFFLISYKVWNLALRHYSSAGN
ncbi:ABC transporter permease [Thermoanaerobacter sp. RKWS2]|uniref:ABC transporter permease n=1 Tax=Thermoanaerobacter sp. RKWS2 TaxID=2983842 RepID=UPI00224AF3BA|nr:ABC-2 family transporter protein [Thermoanaerobacter sp. RKWS2]UZQ83388.1 ABC-2 family transporter protein [Thermoanaerobacter sp. RKWS2]